MIKRVTYHKVEMRYIFSSYKELKSKYNLQTKSKIWCTYVYMYFFLMNQECDGIKETVRHPNYVGTPEAPHPLPTTRKYY